MPVILTNPDEVETWMTAHGMRPRAYKCQSCVVDRSSTGIPLSVTLAVIFDGAAFRRFVRHIPSKVDFHPNDLVSASSGYLAITKPVPPCGSCLIDDDCSASILGRDDFIERIGLLAVGPATAQISRTIQLIVDWT